MSNELSSNEIPKKLSCTTCACPLGGDSGNVTTEARAKDAVHASAETRKKTWRSEVKRIEPGNTQTTERYKAKRLSEKEGPKECGRRRRVYLLYARQQDRLGAPWMRQWELLRFLYKSKGYQ